MILNNCRLIPALSDGVGTELGGVEIENGKIVKVSPTPLTGEDAFDCGGKTLLPGIIDLHTHITFLNGIGISELHDPMALLVASTEQVKRFLDYGVTTIRDCGSFLRAGNYVRSLIAKGLCEGPDVIACGQTIMTSVVDGRMPATAHISFADGADACRKAVREEAANQADFIKIYASGSALNPTGIPTQPIMTEEEIKALVEAADMSGLYIASHCHSDGSIRLCIENGVKTIEHGTYMSDDSLELLLTKPDCYLVPTMSAMYVSQTDSAERQFWLDRLSPMLESCAAGIEKAYRAGQKLGFGTDSTAGSAQYEKGVEFQMRKEECHMDNVDILLQATKYNAEIAGIDHLVGQIKAGLAASLILTDGNPDQDMSVMYGRPLHVWKAGKMVR